MTSFADALNKTKVKDTTKKKKSDAPVLKPPENVMLAVDRFVTAKTSEKKAKAEVDEAHALVATWARTVQDDDGYSGKYKKSYKIQGITDIVSFITGNKFSISGEDTEQIEAMLGEKDYANLIEETPSVRLKDEVLENQELQDKLMALIGDRFGDFFETTTKVAVCEDFDQKIYHHIPKEELESVRTFIRPFKATLR